MTDIMWKITEVDKRHIWSAQIGIHGVEVWKFKDAVAGKMVFWRVSTVTPDGTGTFQASTPSVDESKAAAIAYAQALERVNEILESNAHISPIGSVSTFTEYYVKALHTAQYPRDIEKSESVGVNAVGLTYVLIGLAGEVGEILNKWKKYMRDLDFHRVAMIDELGDVLWYVAMACRELNIPMEEVARLNIEKLAKRNAAGTISGDNRGGE